MDEHSKIHSLPKALRDIVALSTLPAVWFQHTPKQLVDSLAELLFNNLNLEFTFISISGNAQSKSLRTAYNLHGFFNSIDVNTIYHNLSPWFSSQLRSNVINRSHPLSGEGSFQISITAIGPSCKHGVLVAGSKRTDFPNETERLLINVAVNQAAVTIEQKRAQERAERAENAIRESETRYVLASRATRDAIWDWNLLTNEVIWNEAIHTEYGYPKEIRKGNASWWYENIHPEDRVRIKSTIHQIIDSGKQNWQNEYRFQRADGTYASVFDRGYVVYNRDGGPIRMLGAMQDVSFWKESELKIKALHQQANDVRQELHDFIEQSPAAMYMLKGPRHVYTLVNSHYLKLVNRKADILLGKEVTEVFSEAEAGWFLPIVDRVYQTGVSFIGKEIPYLNSFGTEYFINVVCQAFHDPDGKIVGILGLALDVSEEVRARKKAEELAEDLQVALQARDDFLSIASHELKTPITSIKLQIQMIFRSLVKSTVSTISKERLEKMLVSSNRQIGMLVNLVDDLLDVSRIINGKLLIEPAVMNLYDLISEVTERFQDQLAESKISLTVEADNNIRGTWDWYKLEQILINLLTNAIKYGEGNPIRIVVKNFKTKVHLSVTDGGIGIPIIDHERIFKRFERVNEGSGVSGLGLGLFIVKEIVASHGGKIWVESEVAKGSTFTVELPLVSSELLLDEMQNLSIPMPSDSKNL